MKKLTLLSVFLCVFSCVSAPATDKHEKTARRCLKSKNYLKLVATGLLTSYCLHSSVTSLSCVAQGIVDNFTYNTFRYCDGTEHTSYGTVYGYNWINSHETYCGELYGKNSGVPIDSIPLYALWAGVTGLAGCAGAASVIRK